MTVPLLRILLGIFVLTPFLAGAAAAQTVQIGGRTFIDYFYRLGGGDNEISYWQSPSESIWDFDSDGVPDKAVHGFAYRRMYLTADATISERFKARFRLDAKDKYIADELRIPFVKDLWIDWNYAGEHSARVGIMPTPAFELTERFWGFRSLEKNVLDAQGVNASRDFGIRFDGPVPVGNDLIRYAGMVANGDPPRSHLSIGGEAQPEYDKYKRGYARISIHPTDKLIFSAGADYRKYSYQHVIGGEIYAGPAYRATRMSVFGGYAGGMGRFGAEAFLHRLTMEWENAYSKRAENEAGYIELQRYDPTLRKAGVSVFGSFKINPMLEFTGRFDLVNEQFAEGEDIMLDETLIVAGMAISPHENVRIIPNLWWFGADFRDDDFDYGAEFVGKQNNRMLRITFEASF